MILYLEGLSFSRLCDPGMVMKSIFRTLVLLSVTFLNLLQQNSLSCFLTGFCWSVCLFLPPFVLKVSALDYESSRNCSSGCFLRKSMIVVDLQVEAKK